MFLNLIEDSWNGLNQLNQTRGVSLVVEGEFKTMKAINPKSCFPFNFFYPNHSLTSFSSVKLSRQAYSYLNVWASINGKSLPRFIGHELVIILLWSNVFSNNIWCSITSLKINPHTCWIMDYEV